MAHVRRLPSGRWQARFRDADDRERTVGTFARRKEAQHAAEEAESKVRSGQWIDPKLARKSFGEFAEEVMAGRLHLRPASRSRDESYLKNHVISAFGDVPLQRITKNDVQRWVRQLSEEYAARTVRECHRLLAGIMAEAVDQHLITESPCRKVKMPRIENHEKRFLTAEQVRHLADAMAPEYRATVFVGGYLGLRWGEMAGLKREHMNLLKKEVRIVGTLERV